MMMVMMMMMMMMMMMISWHELKFLAILSFFKISKALINEHMNCMNT